MADLFLTLRAGGQAQHMVIDSQVLKVRAGTGDLCWHMYFLWKSKQCRVVPKQPELRIGPPRRTVDVSTGGINPASPTNKMSDLSVEKIAPGLIHPAGGELLVAIQPQDPFTGTGLNHLLQVSLDKATPLDLMNGCRQRVGNGVRFLSGAFCVHENDQFIHDLAHLRKPLSRLGSQSVGQENATDCGAPWEIPHLVIIPK